MLKPVQPEAALAAIAELRPDVSLDRLTRRLEDQLVRQVKHKSGSTVSRCAAPTVSRRATQANSPHECKWLFMRLSILIIARAQARKDGDVDWDLFVRVVRTRADLTEGEAVEKLQSAWRVVMAKKSVAERRLQRDVEALASKTKRKSGKKGKRAKSPKAAASLRAKTVVATCIARSGPKTT